MCKCNAVVTVRRLRYGHEQGRIARTKRIVQKYTLWRTAYAPEPLEDVHAQLAVARPQRVERDHHRPRSREQVRRPARGLAFSKYCSSPLSKPGDYKGRRLFLSNVER